MKFTVGLPVGEADFLDCISRHREHICEVYFSWGDFPNGRSSGSTSERAAPWLQQQRQMELLGAVSSYGIGLNLLFNATCYGADSQSRAFFHKIGETVEFIGETYGLASVTTTSPLIAKFVKENFDGIDVRASVNMEIGSIEGISYLSELFDSFYELV